MSDAREVLDDIYAKYGKCIIHAVSTPNVQSLFDHLPFNIRATKQGFAFDGIERLHIAAIEYHNGHNVLIGGLLTEDEHYLIYKAAHQLECDAMALVPFELRTLSEGHPVQKFEAWQHAVKRLQSDGITISSEGKLLR